MWEGEGRARPSPSGAGPEVGGVWHVPHQADENSSTQARCCYTPGTVPEASYPLSNPQCFPSSRLYMKALRHRRLIACWRSLSWEVGRSGQPGVQRLCVAAWCECFGGARAFIALHCAAWLSGENSPLILTLVLAVLVLSRCLFVFCCCCFPI